jgi:hypothetical protein
MVLLLPGRAQTTRAARQETQFSTVHPGSRVPAIPMKRGPVLAAVTLAPARAHRPAAPTSSAREHREDLRQGPDALRGKVIADGTLAKVKAAGHPEIRALFGRVAAGEVRREQSALGVLGGT